MILITTELKKWKRNKTIWGFLALTILFTGFAVARAFFIPRSDPQMDSFGDLYTWAFTNITSLLLPVMLGLLVTMLFFEEQKNQKYVHLQVSDVPKASLILERQFHVTDYTVQDEHNLRIYDTALDMAILNKTLVMQDVDVTSFHICNDTLEDYFKQITGGKGIA